MSKIALAMIVKDSPEETKLLSNCLKSVRKHVDAVYLLGNNKTGTMSTKLKEVARRHQSELTGAKWTGSFAEMRQKSFDLVPDTYDFILWLDTDDTVTNPEKIREVLGKAPESLDGLMVKYNYDKDDYGNTITEHINLRVVRNNGSFEWKGKLHETLVETRRVNRAFTEDFTIEHHADNDRKGQSNIRNIRIMEEMIEEEGDSPDPRTLYYLGTAYIDAGFPDRAKDLLETYIQLSGWNEERAQAHVWLGRLYRDNYEDSPTATNHFLRALYENPKEVTAFIELGSTEMMLKRWKKALVWLEQAVVMKPSQTALVTNPLERTYRAYMMLAQCHLEIGGANLDKAFQFAQHAHKIRPDDITTDFLDMLKKIMKEKSTVQSFINAVRKAPQIANVAYGKLDDEYKKNPAIIATMRQFQKAKKWPKKSIAIYCGSSVLKDWGPWSLESGIGGSEEAVIRLSKHLNDMGWKVTVYSNPGIKDGTYDGVEWKNYWEIDLRDEFDVFIAWRAPEFFDVKVKARKTYCWMHDVMDDSEFTEKRLKNIDKVILLSKYHRSVYPSIPDNKVFYSGNGIDPEEFEKWDGKLERNPQQVIYQSSHVRGLDTLLEIWPTVLREVPEAKLTVAYGWESFDNINRDNPERMAWKDAVVKKMDELGVTDLGRIGQEEIVKMTQTAGVWAYPTAFCEIYCITAVKAQAGGAWPVCTDFAALAEYVNFGDIAHMEAIDEKTPIGKWEEGMVEKYTKDLIFRLKNPIPEVFRENMMKSVREKYSWRATGEGWNDEFSS